MAIASLGSGISLPRSGQRNTVDGDPPLRYAALVSPFGAWQPTRIERQEAPALGTSTRATRVLTDTGRGFLKAMGNPEGEHALASEWIGTALADWFGLPTLDYALIDVTPEVPIDLTVGKKKLVAKPGPAFITREEEHAWTWSGDAEDLKDLENGDVTSRLVLFDTWVRNPDRAPPIDPSTGRPPLDPSTGKPSRHPRRPNFDNVLLVRHGRSAVGLIGKDVWVESDMKETDLTHVHPGQPVDVTIDTYPGCHWAAHVASVSAGSDSSFSALPAENASGNWVKVVQRIPVRIALDGSACKQPLRAGMSAVISIDTGHRRWWRMLNG